MLAVTTDKLWSMFVAAWDGSQPCKSMVAGYHPVDDDPDCPPYDAPCLWCAALDGLLNSTPEPSDGIPF
jgi:hypothetical protein